MDGWTEASVKPGRPASSDPETPSRRLAGSRFVCVAKDSFVPIVGFTFPLAVSFFSWWVVRLDTRVCGWLAGSMAVPSIRLVSAVGTPLPRPTSCRFRACGYHAVHDVPRPFHSIPHSLSWFHTPLPSIRRVATREHRISSNSAREVARGVPFRDWLPSPFAFSSRTGCLLLMWGAVAETCGGFHRLVTKLLL